VFSQICQEFNSGLQGCDTVALRQWLPAFRRIVVPSRLTLKMAAPQSFEILGTTPNGTVSHPEKT
jgi:hypothetical protein